MKPADVQLEHGYVRVANRLMEALLAAPISGVQFKIMHTLVRLTYGWRKRTVIISHADLASYAHVKPSGSFRDALRDLIANNLVIQVERGGGKTKSTLAIQKDFTQWRKYQVGPDRLAIIFGERPDSADDTPFQPGLFESPDTVPETRPPASMEAGTQPESRPAPSLEVGTGTLAKSLFGETYEGGKTEKDSRKTILPSIDGLEDLFAYAELEPESFGEHLGAIAGLIRSARNPAARAKLLVTHLPVGGGKYSPAVLGLAASEFVAQDQEFNAAYFAGFVRRAASRLQLKLEDRHVEQTRVESNVATREDIERKAHVADFARNNPTRYAELYAQATTDHPGRDDFTFALREQKLAQLVRAEESQPAGVA